MLNKKITLVTDPINLLFAQKKTKKIFLGNHYDFENLKKKEKKDKKKIISTPWINQRKKENDFLYLLKKFEKFSSILQLTLNNIHQTNFSKKYWEQVYGLWLIDFLVSVYEKYSIIKKLKNSKNYIAYTSNLEHKTVPKNTREAKVFYVSDVWNHSIYINLIKEFKKNIKIIVNNKYKNKNILKYKKEKFNLKTYAINTFSKITGNLKKKNEIFIINSCLPFINELMLQAHLNKIIKINLPFDKSYSHKNEVNRKLRNNSLKVIKNDDEFSKFIKKIIIKNLPLTFLEEFKEIRKFNKKLNWVNKPKKIFTSSSNFSDDIFKIWLAEQKKNGSKLFCGQHGSQFINKFCTNDFYAEKTCDKILTWGDRIGEGKKYFSVGNFKTISKKVKIKNKKFISVIQDMPTKYSIRLWSGIDMCNYKDYINLQNIFLNNLNKDNYSKVKIRYGSPPSTYAVNNLIELERKTWLSNHPKLHYETRDINIYSTLENSYLTILTNVTSTLLLECISFNIPLLIFTPGYNKYLKTGALRDFKKLEKKNILFSNPKKLSYFINRNKPEQILSWWYSKKNQQILLEFQKNYARNNKKIIKRISGILSVEKD